MMEKSLMLENIEIFAHESEFEPHLDIGPTTQFDFEKDDESAAPNYNTAIHPMVYKILFALFMVMMAAYLITFWHSTHATFMVVISLGYVLIYFALPAKMLEEQIQPGHCDSDFGEFLRTPIEISTGAIMGWEAAVQVCLIPAAATLAVIGMCIIGALV